MPVAFRAYDPEPLFGEDYRLVRNFLLRLDSSNYSFGRWDWMITHSDLDAGDLPKIGLWTEDGAVVAAALYDYELGRAYLPVLPGYESLRAAMLGYAQTVLAKDGQFAVLIQTGDLAFQAVAAREGYLATQEQEHDAVYPLDRPVPAAPLPEGFHLTTLRETYDLYRYGRALWRGFNHEANGEGPYRHCEALTREMERPNVNLDLKIAVVAPNGDFAAYCGMWQDGRCESALVEPVATDPAYRRLGLGRAAVLEGLRRCAALGAKRAYVGSSQPFYYAIGFQPCAVSNWWQKCNRG